MSKQRRSFTPEFKFQVVMDLLSGRKRRAELLREHQLHESTLEGWCQVLRERGPQLFAGNNQADSAEQARIAELERVIGRLTVELEVLRKACSRLKSR